ncbi:hypothetical protein P3T23_004731 [Paraburkholderia sp. GAS448]|uniref:hypothetical protein n=1 Tax=Paraburkholderia sp. GAS448 TaxID=3035136 RepID=UPI003D19F95B
MDPKTAVTKRDFFRQLLRGHMNRAIIDSFAIPWTTSGIGAVHSSVIFSLLRLPKADHLNSLTTIRRNILLSADYLTIFGLLIIVWPVDAGPAAVFVPAYLYLLFVHIGIGSAAKGWRTLILPGVRLVFFGIILFPTYNTALSGIPFGGYFKYSEFNITNATDQS